MSKSLNKSIIALVIAMAMSAMTAACGGGDIAEPAVAETTATIKTTEDASHTETDSTEETTNGKAESVKNNENMYRIYVKDQDASPVEGAMVQFCTDTTCLVGQTDKDGMASFTEAPGIYDVHILSVPDGYDEVTEGYNTIDSYSDMTIKINKK